MGNIFGKSLTLKEIVRENQRMLKKAIRELEREISALQNQEKKLVADIKKLAKQNQMSSVKVMAKDLVRSRAYVARFIEMKAHLTAVSLKMQTIKSNEAMADAMKGVTKALVAMNKKVKLPGLQKLMVEFMTENERAEIMQEAIGDTMDDAFEEEGASLEEDKIVSQVLDELGLGVNASVPEAPVGSQKEPEEGVRVGEAANVPDPGMSALEERLRNLKDK